MFDKLPSSVAGFLPCLLALCSFFLAFLFALFLACFFSGLADQGLVFLSLTVLISCEWVPKGFQYERTIRKYNPQRMQPQSDARTSLGAQGLAETKMARCVTRIGARCGLLQRQMCA